MSDSTADRGSASDHSKAPRINSYGKLAISLAISLLVMWVLTMSMIWVIDDYYWNLSNFYMALIMVAPMGIIMVLVMWSMFPRLWINIALLAGFVALFVTALLLGRGGVFVGDEQFLKSMIPHHSRAVLVCEQSDITDPEIIALCDTIVQTQLEEIDQMKDILDRY
ncbi:MAG: DUF305 domain-containing protein [Microbacterium sp.]|uniref:DUF305 domain-containing protein n=1 Tax=unclassified Microbacterium TaxID=2609290 RepID=UPI000DB71A0D|nr:DUF305 domain-containing protein [Microbacterium sp.]PZU40378.1 MAG: DUF305 domain-containing protein [Microbacterium sp.]